MGCRQDIPKKEEVPMSTIAELKTRYRRTAERLPYTLDGYSAMSQKDRDEIRDECFELNMQISHKYHEGRWLTWFGVDLK